MFFTLDAPCLPVSLRAPAISLRRRAAKVFWWVVGQESFSTHCFLQPWVDSGRFGDLKPCQSLSSSSDFSSKRRTEIAAFGAASLPHAPHLPGEPVSSRVVSVGVEGAEHTQQYNAAQPECCRARAKSRMHALCSTQVLQKMFLAYACVEHTSLLNSRVFQMRLLEIHKRSFFSMRLREFTSLHVS